MNDLNDNLTQSTLSGDPTMPTGDEAGYGEDAVLDLIASEGMEKKKKSGALVIVAVVALAAASLFSMHTLTKVHAGGESNPNDESTVEGWIKRTPEQHEADIQNIIVGLTHDYTEGQIPLEKLTVADPFPDVDGSTATGPVATGNSCEDDLRKAAKDLKLNSVLLGSTPTAIINGKLARLNREVTITVGNQKVPFLVTMITADSATVIAKCPDSDVKVETTIFLKRW